MPEQQILYVDYDFDTLVTQLQQRLALTDTWKDLYQSATGSMLIELFASIGTLVLYYVERRAEESYILTAQNRSSIINLARLLNYIPSRNVSATGTLRFSISSAHTKMVFIPKYTECQTASGYKYLTSTEGVIMPGQLYVDIPGVQGIEKVVTNSSAGTMNQEYNIADTSIENSNVTVVVDGVIWTSTTSFIDSTSTSEHYVIRPELDDTITIVFGNNVFGKAPALGVSIDTTYIESAGLVGSVYSTDLITTLNSTIYDEDETTQTVTVSNTTSFLGGANLETTEGIRENAPAVFATGDRYVTKSDFITALNAYSGVADSNAWGEAEETNPDYDLYNQVRLAIILDNWLSPDTTFQATLSDFLYEKSLMTIRYSYVDPVILSIIPTVTLKVIAGNSLSSVQSDVETAVSSAFTLGTTTKLGTAKRHSDILASIEAVDGMSYSYLTLKIRKELLAGYNSTYNWAETLDALPLLAGGVEIYVDDTRVATDDGVGGFTDVSSDGYTVSGVVNYTTGVMGVDISPAPGALETVYARYQQNQNGDIVPTKSQICRWIKNDYTGVSYAT